MSRFISFMFALLLIFGHQQICKSEDNKFDITKYTGYTDNAIKFGIGIYTEIEQSYNKLQYKTTIDSKSDSKLDPGMEQCITDKMKHVSKKLDFLKVNMQNMKEEIIDKIANIIPEQVSLRGNLFEIYQHINQIENLYDIFSSYIKKPRQISNKTLKRFAKAVTSHKLTDLPNVLKMIHWLLIQTDVNVGHSVLTILSRSTQAPTKICQTKQSHQQMLYHLYNAITLVDVKGYVMIQFGYNVLQFIEGGDRLSEMQIAEQQFINRLTNTLKAVTQAMRSASRALWTCDTSQHKEEVTYTKLNNVFQKYVINEADMNEDGTCTLTCPDYNQTKVYGCYDKQICDQQKTCSGNLWECEDNISSAMYVCLSDKNSNRRYEYVKYGNSKRYGPKGKCTNPGMKISNWNRGFSSCSYCLCTCDDLGYTNSDRYINLRSVVSDIYNNYVVTGVRFRKSNHIVHIQIQEGQLLPGGRINRRTVLWKPIQDYKINKPIPKTKGTKWEKIPVENIDYHVLEWKVRRKRDINDKYMYRKAAINLDDLDFADQQEFSNYSNYVVGGFKFLVNEVRDSGYHLNLAVFMVPFNYPTGKVLIREVPSQWYSAFSNLSGRARLVIKSDKTEVNLKNLGIPTDSGATAVPTSKTNQFLYFTTSGLSTDAGQNTIPYIDLKPVQTNPPSPLSGAGIFYKSSPDTAGFLSLKLFTYDYSSQMQSKED